MIFAGLGGLPDWLSREVVEALDALDAGTTMPIFKAEQAIGTDLPTARAQLRLVTFVKFRSRAYGETEDQVRQYIGGKIFRSVDAISKWEGRLKRSCLGSIEVHREITFAKNAASHVRSATLAEARGEHSADRQVADSAELRYGPEALQEAIDHFRKVDREGT